MSKEVEDSSKRREMFKLGATEGNIFSDEIEQSRQSGAQRSTTDGSGTGIEQGAPEVFKTKDNTALVLDPDPRSRIRWERRKVIQMVRNKGQPLTRDERIRMTERELTHKSPVLTTSTKKLVMLSRQIAGKPVEDAINQMRWSKKKYARHVLDALEEARDLAIASRGMGLGKVNGELFREPKKIKSRDGKWMLIEDPTSMYVAQSWVGRNPIIGRRVNYMGRGRMSYMKHPSARKSMLRSFLPQW